MAVSGTLSGSRGSGTLPGAADGSAADWLSVRERAVVNHATDLFEAVVMADVDAAGATRRQLLALVTEAGASLPEPKPSVDPAPQLESGVPSRGSWRAEAIDLIAELLESLLAGDDPASPIRLALLGEATRLAGAFRSVELGRVVAGHAAVAAGRAPAVTLLAAAECLGWLPPGVDPGGEAARLRCDLLIVETLSYLALGDRAAARCRLRDASACGPDDRRDALSALEAELVS